MINKKLRAEKFIPFTGSILLHLCFFLLLIGHFHFFSHPLPTVGKKNAQTIQSYLYHGQLSANQTSHPITSDPALKQTENKIFKQTTTHSLDSQAITQNTAPSSEITGQSANTLLGLLHSAIQKAQIYPEAALSMQRSGRVTVSFDLSPDGNIANLKLVKSSDTSSLDSAALDAIRQASPFQGINNYLTAVKNFQIDVVFEIPKETE